MLKRDIINYLSFAFNKKKNAKVFCEIGFLRQDLLDSAGGVGGAYCCWWMWAAADPAIQNVHVANIFRNVRLVDELKADVRQRPVSYVKKFGSPLYVCLPSILLVFLGI